MDDAPENQMSAYEQRRWDELTEHWRLAAEKRKLPPNRVTRQLRKTAAQVSRVATPAVEVVEHAVHSTVEHARAPFRGSRMTSDAVLHLLRSTTTLTARLTDPQTTIDSFAEDGIMLRTLADMRDLDLETVEGGDRHLELHWRSVGLLEGGAVGALSLVPVPAAGFAAISLDLVVVRALTIALATHIAHSFGFGPADLDPGDIINAIARSSVLHDAVQAEGVSEAGAAGDALVGSAQVWSARVAEDPRVANAAGDLIETVGEGEVLALDSSAAGIPIVGMLLGAGFNQHALGRLAHEGQLYAATLFLMRKYGLEAPDAFPEVR
ncbi:hypothetical protein [Flaviflexus huanghaiensis]|uniref:hypothetical protein n=1 Tax=Flaviflexus huanghaiensis TaxID=1111473 RepID=UPI0015FB9422|nr:hypothetical protein [Flaviflexus huanghaiensis]